MCRNADARMEPVRCMRRAAPQLTFLTAFHMLWAAFSTTAFSISDLLMLFPVLHFSPMIYSSIFHSCIFYSRIFSAPFCCRAGFWHPFSVSTSLSVHINLHPDSCIWDLACILDLASISTIRTIRSDPWLVIEAWLIFRAGLLYEDLR